MSVKNLLIRKATEDGRYSVAFCWKFQCKMLFGFLILPNVEKNLECTLAHNTSFFCLFAEGKNF